MAKKPAQPGNAGSKRPPVAATAKSAPTYGGKMGAKPSKKGC